MTTPTNDCGSPAAATPSSMAGDSTFARPTTATSATSSRPEADQRGPDAGRVGVLVLVERRVAVGGDRQEEVAVPDGLGEHEQRRRAPARRPRRRPAATAENSGPGWLVVNVGSTRLSIGQGGHGGQRRAGALGVERRRARGAARRAAGESPTMPLQVIITAAKTVSRASVAVSVAAGDHQRDDQRRPR